MLRVGKNEHFIFPKLHIMSNYPEGIKCFSNAIGFTTGIGEVMHII